MIKFSQGETALFEVAVMDALGQPSNLTGVTGVFAYYDAGETVKKACSIADNIVTAKLLPAETADLLGEYPFEVRLQDLNSDVDMVTRDYFLVEASILPIFAAE